VTVRQPEKQTKKRDAARGQAQEAFEQLAATAEILRVISMSPADLDPVFKMILSSASRLCRASVGAVFMFDGELLTNVAHQNASPEFVEYLKRTRSRPSRESTTRWCALDRRTVHTADLMNDPNYSPPDFHRQENVRAALSVPMLRENNLIGVITLWRREATRFTDRQIALVQAFADQAVMAIENVRLFKELQARNVEITESLEQQTATADILSMINNSPTDLQPVFDTILEKAIRLCDAHMGHLRLYDGENFIDVAQWGVNAEYARFLSERGIFRPPKNGIYARMTTERRPLQIEDIRNSSEYRDGLRGVTALVELGGARTFILVPMLKDGRLVGGISIYRSELRPFTQRQIDLVSTFANEAVIAIENVRLFNETREALEQQTAISEILHVISGSPGDVERMLEAVALRAVKLCESGEAGIFLLEEERLKFVAGCQTGATFQPGETIPLGRGSILARAVIDRETVHIVDLATVDAAQFPVAAEYQQQFGHRSLIAVPLMQKGRAIGVIGLWRFEVRGFTEKHIALVRTFADQAAIAIENVSLFNEIQEKSRQLEIASRHKSEFLANMSHELRTPLNAIIGFTRIVMRRAREQLEVKQYENLEKILASGQHLLALINSILDLAKVEAGRVEINPDEIALSQMLESCIRTIEPLVKADAVKLERAFDDGLPQIYVDEEKLRQIVINLLSNAAKFTVRGSIRLRAQAANDGVVIAVSDTGVGIAPDKLEVIFEEFAQADASNTRTYGGTGLGLTIARRLARLMRGEITAESVLGSGSTFTLTLPIRYNAANIAGT
jgi:signal transduction histidine kinase